MGILIIFLIFIYGLKLNVKRLKLALTLDERVETVLLSGRQGWTQRQVADEFNARHPELQTVYCHGMDLFFSLPLLCISLI
jgi:hypothetical protein